MACIRRRWHSTARRRGSEPERAYYHYQLGATLCHLGLLEDALDALLEAALLAPKIAFYRFRVATLYQQMGRDEQGYVHMEITCRLAPHDDYYLVRLAGLAVASGHPDAAIRYLQRAAGLRPRNTAYQHLLAEAYALTDDRAFADTLRRKAGPLDAYDAIFVGRRLTEWRVKAPLGRA